MQPRTPPIVWIVIALAIGAGVVAHYSSKGYRPDVDGPEARVAEQAGHALIEGLADNFGSMANDIEQGAVSSTASVNARSRDINLKAIKQALSSIQDEINRTNEDDMRGLSHKFRQIQTGLRRAVR